MDAFGTSCGNGVNQLRKKSRRPASEDKIGSARSRPLKQAGDVLRASCNHPHPAPAFFLPCHFCREPVELSARRFAELFDADRLPDCAECRKFRGYLGRVRLAE